MEEQSNGVLVQGESEKDCQTLEKTDDKKTTTSTGVTKASSFDDGEKDCDILDKTEDKETGTSMEVTEEEEASGRSSSTNDREKDSETPEISKDREMVTSTEVMEEGSDIASTTDGSQDEQAAAKDGYDVYSYTRREEFTSENFKIELRGVPRYYQVKQLKKLLNETLDLNAHKVKPAGQGRRWAYINFRDEAARVKASQVLQGYEWKKCTFKVSYAKPVEDPLVKIREEKEGSRNENSDPSSNLSITERVTRSVIPYANLSYEQQLEKKQRNALQVLRKFGSDLAHNNRQLSEFVTFQKKRWKGQVCEVDDIVPSPVIDNYRNKCEFTIGINPENGLPTVGFRIASYKEGSMHVAPVSHLRHIPQQMKDVVEEFDKLIRASGLNPFSPLTHEGFWRQLNVRTTRNSDILIIPMIHPQDMNEERVGDLKKQIVTHFTTGPGACLGITSIFFKAYGQKEKGKEPDLELLWGEECITETILGKKFRVSPDAFLQVNTAAAEVLYEKISCLAKLDTNSVLLDICCGTGTIGISLADRCKKVYGVEMGEKAADDAKHNAKKNGLENVAVFTGKAEDNMPFLMNHCTKDNTVGVVDPPRAGLHNNVIFGLRKCETLKSLVFVSCDANNAIRNFISLGRAESKQYKGEFFVPVRAIPVDLFPHTPHFELIILFERWDQQKWKHIMQGTPQPLDEKPLKSQPDVLKDNKREPEEEGDDEPNKKLKSDEKSDLEEASKLNKGL